MDVEEQMEMTSLNNGSCPIELLLYEAFKAHDKHYKSVTNMAPFFPLWASLYPGCHRTGISVLCALTRRVTLQRMKV